MKNIIQLNGKFYNFPSLGLVPSYENIISNLKTKRDEKRYKRK